MRFDEDCGMVTAFACHASACSLHLDGCIPACSHDRCKSSVGSTQADLTIVEQLVVVPAVAGVGEVGRLLVSRCQPEGACVGFAWLASLLRSRIVYVANFANGRLNTSHSVCQSLGSLV